jgi:hypothetical protein
MDHETAIRVQAAERYILNEFSPEERADFEEHFFGCPACGDEVRSATILAANAGALLREEDAHAMAQPSGGRARFRLFWPLLASAAVNLVLLAGYGLQRFQPGDPVPAAIEPQFFHSFGVPAASRSSLIRLAVPAGSRFFGARFDLMPDQRFESFAYQILDARGTSLSRHSLQAPAGNESELEIAVPVLSLTPGDYMLVLRGSRQGKSEEISRAQFSIQR